jgi:hypothetical protein
METGAMSDLSLDQHDTRALRILIAVCDRQLGREAVATQHLRLLLQEPSMAAYERAADTFNGLGGAARERIADESNLIARETLRAFTDMRQQLPGLFGTLNRRPGGGSRRTGGEGATGRGAAGRSAD